VAGCIPIRYPADAAPQPDNVEVLLITSRGGKGWVFPKGGWEDDESVEAAARRETVEEAGVRGTIEEPMVGSFSFQSAKQERQHNVHQGRCRAYMFVMRVAEELEAWPEGTERQRCWVPLAEASSKCRHQWMRDALNTWIDSKGWQTQLASSSAVAAVAAVSATAAAAEVTAALQAVAAPANSDSGSLSSC
jgi:diphosphoinositol-polyphosphate diphosphatase